MTTEYTKSAEHDSSIPFNKYISPTNDFFEKILLTECKYTYYKCHCCEWTNKIAESLISTNDKLKDIKYDLFFASPPNIEKHNNEILYIIVPRDEKTDFVRNFGCKLKPYDQYSPCFAELNYQARIGKITDNGFEDIFSSGTNGIILTSNFPGNVKKTNSHGLIYLKYCIELAVSGSVVIFKYENKLQHIFSKELCSNASYEEKRKLFNKMYSTYKGLE